MFHLTDSNYQFWMRKKEWEMFLKMNILVHQHLLPVLSGWVQFFDNQIHIFFRNYQRLQGMNFIRSGFIIDWMRCAHNTLFNMATAQCSIFHISIQFVLWITNIFQAGIDPTFISLYQQILVVKVKLQYMIHRKKSVCKKKLTIPPIVLPLKDKHGKSCIVAFAVATFWYDDGFVVPNFSIIKSTTSRTIFRLTSTLTVVHAFSSTADPSFRTHSVSWFLK